MNSDQTFLIPVPSLFSFDECLWFLDRNYDDCLHVIKGKVLYKAVKIGAEPVLFSIEAESSFLKVTVLAGEASRENKDFLIAYIAEWFDMNRNIQPFYDLLKTDGQLAYMTETYEGFRLIGIYNIFEAICWCIVGQQINLSFAYKVKRRLVERYGEKVNYENESYYIFPDPEVLLQADLQELKSMQFSERKALYVIGIAKAFHEGTLDKEAIRMLPDFDSKVKVLTAHKGIGLWTANYALMKSLHESQAIPHGDIGLLQALANNGIIGDRSETDKIDALFSSFAGWESYLVFYLWRSLTVRI
ncbi:DNA-3-methyladenine glycosylase family protein [Dyadobacter sediminis]|uniref:DNA-3-methyladenine glycosylase II n=1 Tax=Dyadobacter sediminis TaxID=1493691 RepID=A0A5R9KJ45_9BACT|nr:DNA-3-methyladenine glycosylase [Dyadobacter sediminis]TLU96243.1 DNA-3-methyladenine glycosylase 2 family protein [Dyadobacter sediminis]GGB80496.1 DNA-3-methyladenine glycosylase [Dyadobacter sediminis]